MKFHQFTEGWTSAKRLGIAKDFGTRERMFELLQGESALAGDPLANHHLQLESQWISAGQPYYNCWPAVLPMLLSFELDVPCDTIRLPVLAGRRLPALALQFPEQNNPLGWPGGCLRAMLFGNVTVNRVRGQSTPQQGLSIVGDTGEKDRHGWPVHMIRAFPLDGDKTVEQVLNEQRPDRSWHQGMQIPEIILQQVVRIACCVCLIGDDPDLVTPDVLSKDLPAYESADAERRKVIEERARRRGKFGFTLGAEFEKIPHVRRPHPAKVRYGPGWSMLKTILRKGSIVHRRRRRPRTQSVPSESATEKLFGQQTASAMRQRVTPRVKFADVCKFQR